MENRFSIEDARDVKLQRFSASSADPRLILDRSLRLAICRETGVNDCGHCWTA